MRVTLSEAGVHLSRKAPWRKARFYPWGDVHELGYDLSLRINHEREIGSVVTTKRRTLHFTFTDGVQATASLVEQPIRTLAGDFVRYGVRTHGTTREETTADHVRQQVASVQLPKLRRAFAEGREVAFGAVTATAEGLRHGGTLVPWEDMTWLGFYFRYSSRVEASQGSSFIVNFNQDEDTWELPAEQVPNIQTLEKFYDTHVTGQRPSEEQGS